MVWVLEGILSSMRASSEAAVYIIGGLGQGGLNKWDKTIVAYNSTEWEASKVGTAFLQR